jgi:hypothetical protein
MTPGIFAGSFRAVLPVVAHTHMGPLGAPMGSMIRAAGWVTG